MTQVAPRWAEADALLIHVKYKLIVCAYVDDEVLRLLGKLNRLPEVQYGLVALRAIWGGDPLGAPHLL
jgi:hypothetical protein